MITKVSFNLVGPKKVIEKAFKSWLLEAAKRQGVEVQQFQFVPLTDEVTEKKGLIK